MDTKYYRLVNLTGTDYPLVSNKILYDILCSDNNKEFIIGFDISNEEYKEGKRPPHKDRFLYYYLMDYGKIVRGIVKKLKIRRAKNYEAIGINFYYGSEYWAITSECLKDLVIRFDSNSYLKKILKTSFAPSESWIHTVFFSSEWATKGIKYSDWDHRELSSLSPLTYFYYVGSVKILGIEDYGEIIRSKKIFARKMISGKSDALIEKIEINRTNDYV